MNRAIISCRFVAVAAVALAVVLAAGACKKTVKGEESRWSSGNRTVDELAVLYPGFRNALEQRRTEAKTIWEAAKSIQDEKDRIKRMSAANDMLTGGFVGQLAEVDGKVKAIRAKLVEVSGAGSDPNEQRRIEQAKQNAERTLTEVNQRLRQGAPDASSADILLRKVTADLDQTEKELGVAVPAKAAPTKDPNATAPPAAAEPQTWTCEYCDHVNEAGAQKCVNCGADRGKGPDKLPGNAPQ